MVPVSAQNKNFNFDHSSFSVIKSPDIPKNGFGNNKENLNLEQAVREKFSFKDSLSIKNLISSNDSVKFELKIDDEMIEEEPTTPRNSIIDGELEEPSTPDKDSFPQVVNSQDLAKFSPVYSKIKFQNNHFVPQLSPKTFRRIDAKNGELNYVFKNGRKKYPGQAVDVKKRLGKHFDGFKNPSPEGKIYKQSKHKFHTAASKELIFTEGAEQPLEVGFLPPLGIYKIKNNVKVIKTLNGYYSEKIWIALLKTQKTGYSIRSGGNGRPSKVKAIKRPARYVLSDLTQDVLKDKIKFNKYLSGLRTL